MQVTDGVLTVDAIGGTNTKIQYVDIDRPFTGTDTTAAGRDDRGRRACRQSAGVYKNEATVTVQRHRPGSGVAGHVDQHRRRRRSRAYTAPVKVTATGNHTVRARAQDGAGNFTTTALTNFRVVAAGASRAATSR